MTTELSKKIVANFPHLDGTAKCIGNFVDNDDGTVTDTRTGLMWMRFAEGQELCDEGCTGEAKRFSFEHAKAMRREFAGHDDWRLPTVDELKSIVDSARINPAFDPLVFLGFDKTPNPLFWTSTSTGLVALYVSFYSGSSFTSELNYQSRFSVRLVRKVTLSEERRFDVGIDLAAIASRSVSPAVDEERIDSGFDYLLRDIERTEKPSASLMKVLANQRELVAHSGGRLSRTLLHHAAAHKKLQTVKYLCLQCSANVNAPDRDGYTPLDYALAVNEVGVADYLRLKGAKGRVDLSAVTSENVSANTNSSKALVPESLKKTPSTTLLSFPLVVTTSGSGTGTISASPGAESYDYGSTVTLTARSADGSIFAGWDGDATGEKPIVSVVMDAEKSVTAIFLLKPVELSLRTEGSGSGIVMCTPEGYWHPIGTTVTLIATPKPGSRFSGWLGNLIESESTCTLVMDSAKSITGIFLRLSFALDVTTVGSGKGTITRSLEAESLDYDTAITLTACAATGSIFIGWRGDAAGLDAACTIIIDSVKRVTAEFVRLDIPDLGIGIVFDSAEQVNLKSGEAAFVIYVSIANKGLKQIHVELPFSRYVTRHGEEIEQDAWLSGLINGAQGASIRAGSFRKVGLVFFKSKLNGISAGDHLHLVVSEKKPSRRLDFSLRCIDQKSRAFTLVSATVEDAQAPEDAIGSSFETAGILQRIELLEAGLSDSLRKLEALQAPPPISGNNSSDRDAPAQTLPGVLAWLATQDRVSVAILRRHLLPLDLLPHAVIAELNERALNLIGELALEENDDEITIAYDVLTKVISAWKDV